MSDHGSAVDKLLAEAEVFMEEGKIKEAIKILKRAVKKAPNSVMARVNYAAALSETGDANAALQELSTVLKVHPDSFHAHGNAAVIAMEMGVRESAIFHYSAAVVLPAGRDWFDGHYNLANMLAENGAGWEDKAIKHYEEALRIDPDDAGAHSNFADCLRQAGRLKDAMTHCVAALKVNSRVLVGTRVQYFMSCSLSVASVWLWRCSHT